MSLHQIIFYSLQLFFSARYQDNSATRVVKCMSQSFSQARTSASYHHNLHCIKYHKNIFTEIFKSLNVEICFVQNDVLFIFYSYNNFKNFTRCYLIAKSCFSPLLLHNIIKMIHQPRKSDWETE